MLKKAHFPTACLFLQPSSPISPRRTASPTASAFVPVSVPIERAKQAWCPLNAWRPRAREETRERLQIEGTCRIPALRKGPFPLPPCCIPPIPSWEADHPEHNHSIRLHTSVFHHLNSSPPTPAFLLPSSHPPPPPRTHHPPARCCLLLRALPLPNCCSGIASQLCSVRQLPLQTKTHLRSFPDQDFVCFRWCWAVPVCSKAPRTGTNHTRITNPALFAPHTSSPAICARPAS